MEDLKAVAVENLEVLERNCPRCGGKSANPSNPAGRCRHHLTKLAHDKKTPGSWQRAQTKADDALRRQKGKNGTAHKKSSGLGSRASIVKQTKSAERKTGQKLSPDRKNNAKGYAASNTRMVPEKLNRGRHHVDGKKLRAWQKRLKKCDTDYEEFYTYLLAKAQTDTALLSLLEDMHPNDVANFINNEDIPEEPLKKTELLGKEAATKLPAHLQGPHNMPAIHNEIGKTHTVEIHPDIDHLYNVKNFAKQDPRGKVKVGDIKRNAGLKHMADKVPRDANGWVTPDAIDKHIESLPKQKVNVKVMPYNMGSQQHRELTGDKQQYVASMRLHPETLEGMKPEERKVWEDIKDSQHNLGARGSEDEGPEGVGHQFGWARIDPWKAYTDTVQSPNGHYHDDDVQHEPNHGHWHVDEIQSDFQNKDKIGSQSNPENQLHDDIDRDSEHPVRKFRDKAEKAWDTFMSKHGHEIDGKEDEPEYKAYQAARKDYEDEFNKYLQEKQKGIKPIDPNAIHKHLSHGHDDPQHAIHSAVNALGRKMGVNSMSMDTPEEQAWQSGLNTSRNPRGNLDQNLYQDHLNDMVGRYTPETHDRSIEESKDNPYLNSALKKLGHEGVKSVMSSVGNNADDYDWWNEDDNPDSAEYKFSKLSHPEQDMLLEFVRQRIPDFDDYGGGHNPSGEDPELPVHQQLTYDKRPKKLGAENKSKAEVLGDDPQDKASQVQYMKLHKKIKLIRDLVKKNAEHSES
jgi:hypothetical protein